MKKYFEKQLDVIRKSLQSMDENVFEHMVGDAVGTIEAGHKIVVSGLGKNVPICEKFVGTMVSLGMGACFLHTNSAVHGDMGVVKDGDLLILLTKSGETRESVYLEEALRPRKIREWLVTFEKDSTLARRMPNLLLLELEDEGDPWNIMPNNSTTVNLIVLQGLAMQIAERRKLGLDAFRRNHPGGHIGELLDGGQAGGNL